MPLHKRGIEPVSYPFPNMANEREVRLKISTQADGGDTVRALALEIDRLAKEGGEAAPAFSALSKQLADLSRQQNLINQFAELKKKTAEAEAAFKAATAATGDAARALREKRAALEAATAAEARANQTLAESKARLEQNRAAARAAADELTKLKAAVAASGGATAEQKAEIQAVSDRLKGYRLAARDAGAEVGTLAPAQRQAAAAARAATGEFNQATAAFEKTKRSAAGAKEAFTSQSVALQQNRNALAAVGVSTNSLADAQRRVSAESARVSAETRKQIEAHKRAKEAAEAQAKALSGIAASARNIAAPLAGAFAAQQFVTVNAELENIERTFTALTGSAAQAKEEMAFVSAVADKLGINGISAAKAYAALSAATKGTAVEGKATRDVFEATARAMSVAGKSAADTEGALQALSQMASKGTIQMEELRGQLGERLPGALKATADGFGITTKELIDLVSTGRLTADELFPALTKGLNDLYGANGELANSTETLTQEWEHFKNSVGQAFKTIGDAGVVDGLKVGLEGLGAVVTTTEVFFLSLGKTIGTFFAALSNGDVGLRGFSDNAKAAFAEIEKEAQDKLVKASMHNRVLAATLDENGKKALEAAKAQTKNADATKKAGDAATQSGAGWTKLNVIYAELQKKADEASKLAEKNAEARKAEAASAVAVANAFGTEEQKRRAVADAAQVEAAALDAVAKAKLQDFLTAQSQLIALQEEAAKSGALTEEKRKLLETLKQEVEQRQAASEKATAQAAAANLSAAATKTEVQAYADNSARLVELRDAYTQATEKLNELRAAKAAGKDVTEKLAAAEIEAGKAAVLYRDAISDQIEKINALANAKRGELDVASALVRLELEEARTVYDVAKAKGDEKAAAAALLNIKRLEIELAELTAQAKKAEADAALLVAKAKREEAIANGTLTKAKEAELKAMEAAAQVKQVEAKIAEETADRMRRLRDATQGSAGAMNDLSSSSDSAANGLEGVGDAAAGALQRVQQLGEGVRRVGKEFVNAEGFTSDSKGGAISQEMPTMMSIAKQLEQYGVPTEKAWSIAQEFADQNGVVPFFNNQGQQKYNLKAGNPFGSLSTAVQRAAQEYVQRNVGKPDVQAQNEMLAAARAEAEQLARTPAFTVPIQEAFQENQKRAQNVTMVKVQIGGKTQAINVASDGDASALVSVIKQLEEAAARAT